MDHGMKSFYSQNGNSDLARFIRIAIGMAFCPLTKIKKGYELLQGLSKALQPKFQKFGVEFMDYYTKTWFRNRNYSLPSWNFYFHRGATTNNFNEGIFH